MNFLLTLLPAAKLPALAASSPFQQISLRQKLVLIQDENRNLTAVKFNEIEPKDIGGKAKFNCFSKIGPQTFEKNELKVPGNGPNRLAHKPKSKESKYGQH